MLSSGEADAMKTNAGIDNSFRFLVAVGREKMCFFEIWTFEEMNVEHVRFLYVDVGRDVDFVTFGRVVPLVLH